MKQVLLSAILFVLYSSAFGQAGFTRNQGQFTDMNGKPADNILFKACGTGPTIFITTSGLTYVFTQPKENRDLTNEENLTVSREWSAIYMNLVDAQIRMENVVMEDELPGVSNYYYAHCPNGILGVKSYRKITIKKIYPGIDWVIMMNATGMEHDFIVHANGNHHNVRMKYVGITEPITLNENQQLTLVSKWGTLYEGGLKVIRQSDNKILQSYFSITGNEVGYLIVRGGRKCDLIIDPPLQWATQHGSSNSDYGYAVTGTKDGTHDALFTGESDGTDFPVLNAQQGQLYGFEDMVVVRVNASGTRLWSTYYGGTDYESGKGVATDNGGNCYVVGTTGSTDLPVQNSLQANFGGGTFDAFIVKFNATGVRQWASWRGGLQNEYGTAITCDGSGNVYVTGYTNSTTFPTLNAIQSSKNVGYDAFIFKVGASQALQWSTFYGGDDDDKGRGITVDATGSSVYLTGSTLAGTFPVTSGTFQQFSGSAYNAEDGFIVKLTSGQSVLFGTYFGGTDADFGQGITVDNNGNIYVTGYTLSGDFPVANPGNGAYVDSTQNSVGTHDAIVVKCNSSGTTLLWSTYFGGTSPDLGFGIVADPFAGVYICGNTASTDFPVMQPADLVYYQSTQGDGGIYNDMFIAWFDVNDSLKWSTYYGDANGNEAYGISVGLLNEIFVVGVDSNEIGLLKFNPGVPTSTVPCLPIIATTLFPSPASVAVNLQYVATSEGIINIEILDASGRLIRREEHTQIVGLNIFTCDVSQMESGIYFLRMNSAEGSIYRFVKE